jgi:two-component sensor histidine kinase
MSISIVMVREISHRVKNSLMLVAVMLAMQARLAQQPEFGRAPAMPRRAATIARLHDQLWRQPDIETVDLTDFLSNLATAAAIGLAGSLNRRGEPCVVDADLAIQIALLVNELVTNACKTRLP